MQIWKWVLAEPGTVLTIDMPIGARLLTVQMQANSACFWAEVDPKAKKEKRNIILVGTGWEVDLGKDRLYIATIQIGWMVFHAYEVGNASQVKGM